MRTSSANARQSRSILGVEDFIDFHKLDSFKLFIEFLKNPAHKMWGSHALMLAMGFLWTIAIQELMEETNGLR